jgi:hypothetical protein
MIWNLISSILSNDDARIIDIRRNSLVCYVIELEEERELNLQRISSLDAENAALRERTRWIPVGERLPDENVAVLAVVSSAFSDFRYIQIAHHVPSVPQWNTEDGVHFHGTEYQRIAHWMPLPEAPKEDE